MRHEFSEIENIAHDYLNSHYGNLVSIGNSIESNKYYSVRLRSNYPVKSGQDVIAYKIEKLGEIVIEKSSMDVIFATPRDSYRTD